MGLFSFKKKDKPAHNSGPTELTGINELANDLNEKRQANNDSSTGNLKGEVLVKFRKLEPDAVMPNPEDLKMDLIAIDCSFDKERQLFIFPTGLSIDVPTGYNAVIIPRREDPNVNFYMPSRFGIVIPHDRDEIKVEYKHRSHTFGKQPYQVGEVVAQVMVLPHLLVKAIFIDTTGVDTDSKDGSVAGV